ncbi:putative bifunctional diguanylate cyclase/phosphodiesterase [Sphingomonas sp. M1-B02]|uniref:putative bifunctional diguanylate cyclase/phosphodiesterase n=1 Tax=Sphingomonas sp. M1-B02 TaxID=3114300 RepID=UPI00223FB559|nr:EAL domain-containing protein [Sphingomonas sp. S6-11]UZK67752.1 EAL domain-containing protein [Sphingomonas sp. S6-11]
MNRHRRFIVLASCCLVGMLAGSSGIGTGLERSLRQIGWQVRDHGASGQIHIVEIDARSIGAINRWPWPRSNYAQLIDRLRAAGAAQIVFDVDFSSRSDPEQDRAFAASLQRAGGKVVLPTFGQQAGGGREGWTDSLPIPELREHATLAAVSIVADADGHVRRAPIGTMTDGVPRPSLSAMMASVNGAAEQDFPIDFAIDPATIPRHSFIEVRDGTFDHAAIAGKIVLIGATAVEMGDRYPVPNHGVVPGVVIQALAAETLASGVPHEGRWQLPLLLSLGLCWFILVQSTRLKLGACIAAAPVILFASTTLADGMGHWSFPIVPALLAIAVAALAASGMRMIAAAKYRRSHDTETGLPNRNALREAMQTYGGAGVVAARIADFDKLVAGLGDAATTELVRRIRDRISLVAEGSTIYRIEDRVLAWRSYDEEQLETRLGPLRTAMLSPVEVNGRRVDVTLALGFAAEAQESRIDRIVAHATLAADRALVNGTGWHFHDAGEDEAVDRELSLLGELDDALGRGEIQVLYQPKLDLKTDRITSVEALVRWHHPTRGFLRPDLFIPLAERNDRIAGLTLHVLQQTISDLQLWKSSGHSITGAVNLSAKLLISAEFIEKLRELVERSGIAPDVLTFEITESAAMSDPAGAAEALASFKQLGIAISMDDYGTGQSTLNYLKELPLDELKIDRSFVQYAHENRGDGVLVRSTVNLAHELGLKVVAEGVEDAPCLAFLRSIGCDMVQGYLVSKPVPAGELVDLLTRSFQDAA